MESSNYSSDMQDMNAPGEPFRRVADGLRIAIGLGGLTAVVFGAFILFFPGKSAAFTMSIIAALVAVYALVIGAGHLGASLFSSTLTGWSRIGRILLSVIYSAAECEQHTDMHEHCRVCAESCRRCEQACADLLATL